MFSLEFLEIALWVLMVVSIGVYFVLEGFDMGIGITYLLYKEKDRRSALNAMGPFWDGNEVWLIAMVGILFGAFPAAYVMILTGFYNLLIFFLLLLLIRAASIEFRSKSTNLIWRKIWDISFSFTSIFMTFVIGLFFGLMIEGLPVDSTGSLKMNLMGNWSRYSIFTGFLALLFASLQGLLFLSCKLDGKVKDYVIDNSFKLIYTTAFILTIWVFWSFVLKDNHSILFSKYKLFYIFLSLPFLCLYLAFTSLRSFKNFYAFLFSTASLVTLVLNCAILLFPNVVRSSLDPYFSLTIYNASARYLSLKAIFITIDITIPFVFLYHFIAYYSFRKKNQDSTY